MVLINYLQIYLILLLKNIIIDTVFFEDNDIDIDKSILENINKIMEQNECKI